VRRIVPRVLELLHRRQQGVVDVGQLGRGLLLQARGRVTAAEVAEELEVSVKTARRDLESLSTAGLPVYARPGRGGGWQLLGGRTDLSGLSAAEARALFLLAGPHTRLAPEARSALRKLVRALPEPFREHASAAAEAVVLDPAGWCGLAAGVSAPGCAPALHRRGGAGPVAVHGQLRCREHPDRGPVSGPSP
jgi:hypothetical protein